MKSILFFLLFLSSFLPGFAETRRGALYERTLKAFAIEEIRNEKNISLILDNEWVFEGKIGKLEENKLYALNKLTNRRARVCTNPQSPALEITFENPSNRGADKISFQVSLTKESYETLFTVKDIHVANGLLDNFLFRTSVYVTLSDHSIWSIKTSLGKDLAKKYWSPGDRVIVTKNYTTNDQFTLVNLDVSGELYVDYYKSKNEHFYSMRDPRSLIVTLYSELD